MKTALLLFALLLSPAVAGAADLIDLYGDWQAFKGTDEKGRLVCFAGSHPKKSEGKYTQRGEPFIMVTHWPAEKTFGEVRFDAGYTIKDGGPVTVTIGATTVRMTRIGGESAWAESAKDDAKLVAAMKAGSTMVVTGVSSRGTKTTDTFSLTGSSAAFKAIDRACGKK